MLINNQRNSQMSSQLNSTIAVSGQVCTYRKFVLLIRNSIAPNVREYDVKKIDQVVYFYHEFSIRSGIRSERGIASRVLFELDDNRPRNLPELLSVD